MPAPPEPFDPDRDWLVDLCAFTTVDVLTRTPNTDCTPHRPKWEALFPLMPS